MRIGTSHFVSRSHAFLYYERMGFSKEDVEDKFAGCEIFVGPPEVKEGQKLSLDEDFRFHIDDGEGDGKEAKD